MRRGKKKGDKVKDKIQIKHISGFCRLAICLSVRGTQERWSESFRLGKNWMGFTEEVFELCSKYISSKSYNRNAAHCILSIVAGLPDDVAVILFFTDEKMRLTYLLSKLSLKHQLNSLENTIH